MEFETTVYHDPGVWTFSNGDPGYPESWEVEIQRDIPKGCDWCASEYSSEIRIALEKDIEQQAMTRYDDVRYADYP